jgi:hypothetical protein
LVNGKTMIEVSYTQDEPLASMTCIQGKKTIVSLPVGSVAVFGCVCAQIGVVNTVGKQREDTLDS